MPTVAYSPAVQAVLNTVATGGISGSIGQQGGGYPYASLMWPFGGSTAAFPLRWHHLPDEGFNPVAKQVIANVINAVGDGDLEQGVYDATQPEIHPIFSGSSVIDAAANALPVEASRDPEWGPDWPDWWKNGEPGWQDDEWVMPEDLPQTQGDDVAVDFGTIVSGAIDIWQGQTVGGGGQNLQAPVVPPGTWLGQGPNPIPGGKVTVDTATGKVTPCRRRRRRRLLTPTDLNDLAALKTIVGGGQSMNFAVMKAVRR